MGNRLGASARQHRPVRQAPRDPARVKPSQIKFPASNLGIPVINFGQQAGRAFMAAPRNNASTPGFMGSISPLPLLNRTAPALAQFSLPKGKWGFSYLPGQYVAPTGRRERTVFDAGLTGLTKGQLPFVRPTLQLAEFATAQWTPSELRPYAGGSTLWPMRYMAGTKDLIGRTIATRQAVIPLEIDAIRAGVRNGDYVRTRPHIIDGLGSSPFKDPKPESRSWQASAEIADLERERGRLPYLNLKNAETPIYSPSRANLALQNFLEGPGVLTQVRNRLHTLRVPDDLQGYNQQNRWFFTRNTRREMLGNTWHRKMHAEFALERSLATQEQLGQLRTGPFVAARRFSFPPPVERLPTFSPAAPPSVEHFRVVPDMGRTGDYYLVKEATDAPSLPANELERVRYVRHEAVDGTALGSMLGNRTPLAPLRAESVTLDYAAAHPLNEATIADMRTRTATAEIYFSNPQNGVGSNPYSNPNELSTHVEKSHAQQAALLKKADGSVAEHQAYLARLDKIRQRLQSPSATSVFALAPSTAPPAGEIAGAGGSGGAATGDATKPAPTHRESVQRLLTAVGQKFSPETAIAVETGLGYATKYGTKALAVPGVLYFGYHALRADGDNKMVDPEGTATLGGTYLNMGNGYRFAIGRNTVKTAAGFVGGGIGWGVGLAAGAFFCAYGAVGGAGLGAVAGGGTPAEVGTIPLGAAIGAAATELGFGVAGATAGAILAETAVDQPYSWLFNERR